MGNDITTKAIMKRIDAALKQITVSDLNDSKLNAEQADNFIRVVEETTPMLEATRRLPMNSPKRNIDRTGFGKRIMKNPEEEDVTEAAHGEKPDFNTNSLEVQEIVGIVSIKDDTLEDNIEREDFEDTLVAMIAERAALDMEYLFIQGDEALDAADLEDEGAFLKRIDGWIKLADHEVDDGDYDETDVKDLFDKTFNAIPRRYIRNRADWRYWVHYDIEDDYRDYLRARGTALGDAVMTGADSLSYNGIPVIPVGNMPEGKLLLGHPDNLAYGIYRDIRIEPEREAKLRQTDFVVTARVDADYEDEEAAAAGKDYTG